MNDNNLLSKNNDNLIYNQVKEILTTAREKAYSAVNFVMVEAYWLIGKQIVEAQAGNERAEYGTQLLKYLSQQLTRDFGKGFTVTNLTYMRQFYLTFPIRHALRDKLGWTHYRLIIKVSDENARNFYMDECVKSNWSTRQLERQINTHFYERLLSSQDKEAVASEIQKTATQPDPKDFIRNPVVLEFLNIKQATNLYEKDLETALINHLQAFLLEMGSDNPPIGIILCADKSEAIVRYTLPEDNKQIFASKYMLYLPTEQELKNEIYAAMEEEKELAEKTDCKTQ